MMENHQFCVACNGHKEIIKILVPLTDNPNASNKYGWTPIRVTKNVEIRTILLSFLTSKNCRIGLSTSTKTSMKN